MTNICEHQEDSSTRLLKFKIRSTSCGPQDLRLERSPGMHEMTTLALPGFFYPPAESWGTRFSICETIGIGRNSPFDPGHFHHYFACSVICACTSERSMIVRNKHAVSEVQKDSAFESSHDAACNVYMRIHGSHGR